MERRRYSRRHDEVLKVIGDFIRANLPPHFTASVDHLSEPYTFPHHITPTDLRPEIVWWCDSKRELWLFELTICSESIVAEGRGRKRAKYHDLVEAGRAAGYKTTLITIEVGSRGMLAASDFDTAIRTSLKSTTTLCLDIIRTTLLRSSEFGPPGTI